MHAILLIRKYLFRKLAPLFAAVAVILCTVMVIVVISVMGGFLDQMREATKSLTPQVSVVAPWTGFPHYEVLIEQLEQLKDGRGKPVIEAATPVIRSAGIIKFGEGEIYPIAQIFGVEPTALTRVTEYRDKLYWKHKLVQPDDPSDVIDPVEMGMAMQPAGALIDSEKPDLPGMVSGIEVNPWARRDEQGQYDLYGSGVGRRVTLTIVPVTRSGGLLEPAVREFTVVNEFKSGLYEIDDNRVYVPFELLQRMMRMDAYQQVNPDTGEATGETIPARASELLIKGRDDIALDKLEKLVQLEVERFARAHPDAIVAVTTWEQQNERLLNAVGNEKGLITFLFGIISMVAVVMIASTFYMIVLEKTRDIGVLRAIGVSRLGVAVVFQGYGLIIGVIGTVLGVTLACAIVYNLNEIQALLDAWFGWKMWRADIYYFDQIPEQVNPWEVAFIAIGAMVSCLLGATIPAVIAARLKPVEALRHE